VKRTGIGPYLHRAGSSRDSAPEVLPPESWAAHPKAPHIPSPCTAGAPMRYPDP
jgi:hypothetical protein